MSQSKMSSRVETERKQHRIVLDQVAFQTLQLCASTPQTGPEVFRCRQQGLHMSPQVPLGTSCFNLDLATWQGSDTQGIWSIMLPLLSTFPVFNTPIYTDYTQAPPLLVLLHSGFR